MTKHVASTREIVHYLIPQFAKGKTLDVGAGTAKYRGFIREHVSEYLTCDMQAGPNIDYVEDATKLSFVAESFDTVLSFQTLEHVKEPVAMISELYRVLKGGGTCILTMPFLVAEHDVPGDYQRYTTAGLRHLFEKHGFSVVECDGYGGLFSVLSEGVKFLFVHPWTGRKYGFVRRKTVNLVTKFLEVLERSGISNTQHFYSNLYMVARKS